MTDGVNTLPTVPVGSATASPPTPTTPDRGTLGRYVILGLLGKGGMGRVYRAYDPKLRREVAVKVLRDDGGEASVARLMREAQAMAQLSHPNVVPVYDVEEDEGRVFLAMELVDGITLKSWMRDPHPPEEVMRILIEAGRGLAAAHEVDLVHRDFKPGNVMVGSDGRARVMDFGIARGASEPEPPIAPGTTGRSLSAVSSAPDSLSARLTCAGTILGTPAYMAPEQHRSDLVDHRTDQYAFCITLYQALAGERPFRGAGASGLYRAKLGDPPPPPPDVPRHIQAAIVRGLSPNPDDRFASMSALLAELSRQPGRTTRRVALAAAVGVLAIAGWGWSSWAAARQEAICVDEAAAIDQTWNAASERAVREGLTATGLPYAETVAASTTRWLDAAAAQWRDAKQTSCRNLRVDKRWSRQTQARANWCLDVRRNELAALVDRLGHADAGDAETAVRRAGALPPAAPCVDERMLAVITVPDDEARGPIRDAMQDLSRANVLIRSQAPAEALAVAEQALQRAEALDFAPLAARASLTIGDALHAQGKLEDGARATKRAYFTAMRTGALHLAGEAATTLIRVTGNDLSDPDQARDWYDHAQLAHRNAGAAEDGLRLAQTEHALAGVEFHVGDVEAAAERYRHAVATQRALLGAQHPHVAGALNMLASSRSRLGHHDEAQRLFSRALEIQRRAYGPEHPTVAMTLHNMATGLHVAGQFSEAGALYEQSLAIRERSLRANHPDIGLSLSNLAGIAWEMNDKRKSLQLSQRALGILESEYGTEHPLVANALVGVAGTHHALGETSEAVPLLQRAVAIYDVHPRGPRSNEPTARFELAKVLRATDGDFREARAQAKAALTLVTQLGEPGAATAEQIREFLAALPAAADSAPNPHASVGG